MHENSFASCFSVCALIERVVIVLECRSLRKRDAASGLNSMARCGTRVPNFDHSGGDKPPLNVFMSYSLRRSDSNVWTRYVMGNLSES